MYFAAEECVINRSYQAFQYTRQLMN